MKFDPSNPPEFRTYPMRFKITPAASRYLRYCVGFWTEGFVKRNALKALDRRVTFLEVVNDDEVSALIELIEHEYTAVDHRISTLLDLKLNLKHFWRAAKPAPLEALAALADG